MVEVWELIVICCVRVGASDKVIRWGEGYCMGKEEISIAHFDKGNAFYSIIMHYIAQLVGLKELLRQGVEFKTEKLGLREARDETVLHPDIQKSVDWLKDPLSLQSAWRTESLRVPTEEIVCEFVHPVRGAE